MRWTLFFNTVDSISSVVLLKTDSNTGAFLWILQIFWEHLLSRTSANDCCKNYRFRSFKQDYDRIARPCARHERHKCNPGETRERRVQHKWQTSDASATWVRQKQHNFNTSVTRTTRLQQRHEWNIFILITTRVKAYFHIPILDMWWMKYFKERNNFILRTSVLDISPSHPKMATLRMFEYLNNRS